MPIIETRNDHLEPKKPPCIYITCSKCNSTLKLYGKDFIMKEHDMGFGTLFYKCENSKCNYIGEIYFYSKSLDPKTKQPQKNCDNELLSDLDDLNWMLPNYQELKYRFSRKIKERDLMQSEYFDIKYFKNAIEDIDIKYSRILGKEKAKKLEEQLDKEFWYPYKDYKEWKKGNSILSKINNLFKRHYKT